MPTIAPYEPSDPCFFLSQVTPFSIALFTRPTNSSGPSSLSSSSSEGTSSSLGGAGLSAGGDVGGSSADAGAPRSDRPVSSRSANARNAGSRREGLIPAFYRSRGADPRLGTRGSRLPTEPGQALSP